MPNDERDEHRFITRKLGLTVYRQRFTTEDGEHKFARPWHWRKMVNGRRVVFDLGMNKRDAEKLAEEIAHFLALHTNTLDMAIAKYDPRRVTKETDYATFAQLLETYSGALGVIGRKGKAVSASTFKGYKSFLATFLRKVEAYREGKEFESFFGQRHIDYSPWFNQSVDILSAKFITDFKLASLPPPPEGEEEPDEEEALTAKISADTAIRSVRALFSKQAMRYYAQVGLRLPDLSGFLSEPDFGARKYFQLLPPKVIVRVARASLALRSQDTQAYIGYLLTMHCGLRRGEAAAFRTSWLREEDRPMLYVTVKGKFSPKHGHGRKVVLERWVFDTISELGHVTEPAALDRLNEWAKAQIGEEHAVGKAIHELRKCWVSFKAKNEGLLAAQQQAGHRDAKTTTTHYADNLMPDRLTVLWTKPTEKAVKEVAA